MLSGALAIISAADVLRLHNLGFSKFYESCLGFLMRDNEKVGGRFYFNTCANQHPIQHKINGVVWYILGVLITLGAYPLDIAVVSILM